MKHAAVLITLVFAATTSWAQDAASPRPAPESLKEALLGDTTEQIPRYWCGIQCGAGNCQQWCSFQQRCYTYCTPQGMPACYCIF